MLEITHLRALRACEQLIDCSKGITQNRRRVGYGLFHHWMSRPSTGSAGFGDLFHERVVCIWEYMKCLAVQRTRFPSSLFQMLRRASSNYTDLGGESTSQPMYSTQWTYDQDINDESAVRSAQMLKLQSNAWLVHLIAVPLLTTISLYCYPNQSPRLVVSVVTTQAPNVLTSSSFFSRQSAITLG